MKNHSRLLRVAVGVLAMVLAPFLPDAHAQSTPEELRRELETMKQEMRRMQERIRAQEEKIDQLSTEKAVAPPPAETEEETVEKVTSGVMRKIQPALSAASRAFPSQFNPSISLVIDTVASYSENDQANFEFRSAELGLFASIDPFAKGYVFFNGTDDGVEVEEAALLTTSLPWNLMLKGGRFFADFGRLSKFHDHDLPFTNRPIVLDEYVGGESQADGAELSYLFPFQQYVTLTAGGYNKIGGENGRATNSDPRPLSQFTYLGRVATYFDVNDSNGIDVGGTVAYTPKVEIENDNDRELFGVDLTYRYTPLSQAGYRGLVWGSELLVNREKRPVGGFPEENSEEGDPEEPLVLRRRDAVGLYSYLEARMTRVFYPGFLFEYVQDLDDPSDDSTLAFSPFLTIWPSEYQRVRLQYTHLDQPGEDDNQFFLQWTAILGSHVHGFRAR